MENCLLNAEEMAALRRFDECAQDGEGYDVPKEMMQRLAEIGVLRRKSGAYYEHTDFGLYVLTAPPHPSVPDAQKQQSDAWLEVCSALDNVAPGWRSHSSCGAQAAAKAIAALAAPAVQLAGHDTRGAYMYNTRYRAMIHAAPATVGVVEDVKDAAQPVTPSAREGESA